MTRVLTAAKMPLIAFILGGVIVISLLMWRLESLEREYIELHHDHTALVGKLTDQTSLLTTALLVKLGIAPPREKDEQKHEGKVDAQPPNAPHGAPPPTAPPTQSPAAEPPTTKADPAQPTQVLPPSAEPKNNETPPKAESSPQDEKKREDSH